MTVTPTSVQLWERIHDAGLATPENCRTWAIEISKSENAECLHDPRQLGAELIRLGKLTAFQASVLFNSIAIPLAFGNYRITESLESVLGPNWLAGTDTSRPKPNALWCHLLTSSMLLQPQIQSWPPSLILGEKHAAVKHPSLDNWLFVRIEAGCLLGLCAAVEGQSLTARLLSGPMSWDESISMMEQIAAGLQKIHEFGLVHGSISPDAIWCVDDSEFLLRRDAIFPPTSPFASSGNSVLARSTTRSLEFAAPELTLPNASVTVGTDLYALGCVWYRALVRSSPFGNEPQDNASWWSKAHSSLKVRPIDELTLPGTLQRCLLHLLAKNPSSRFESAHQFARAIEVAINEIETKRVSANEEPKARTTQPTMSPTEFFLNRPAEVIQSPSQKGTTSESRAANESVGQKSPTVSPSPSTVPEQKSENPQRPTTPRGAPAITQVKAKVGLVKKKSKKKKKPKWILPAMVGAATLIFGLVIALLVRNNGSGIATVPRTQPQTASPKNGIGTVTKPEIPGGPALVNSDTNPPSKPIESVGEYYSIEADDGQQLWAPPHAGSPYSLEMFPAGVEALLFVSGTVWHHRGASDGIAKWWRESQADVVKLLEPYPLLRDDRIHAIAIGMYPSKKSGTPLAVFRLSFSQPIAIDSLTKGLGGFSLQMFDPKANTKKGLWSNEIPSNAIAVICEGMQTAGDAMVNQAIVGPEELLATLPELNGGSPPVRRQIESLLKSTDSRADLTLLFAPSFLFGDGREILSSFPKVQDLLRNSIDESMQAVAFTTTLEPQWYMELRMIGSETRDAGKFLASLKTDLLSLPDGFESELSSGKALHSYWRALGLRFPQMIRSLIRYGRFGLEDGQIVSNTYLPTMAMNNIVISSWMALQPPMSGAGTTASSSLSPPKPPSKTMDEILDLKVTISFEQESLEAALQLISGEVTDSAKLGSPISMTINGAAFQKEGITRNQSIRSFKQASIPLRTVLMDLVRRANPVTSVQSPSERNQKVVWLVLDDPDRVGQKKIELTTRTWSESNGSTLPKEFVAQ